MTPRQRFQALMDFKPVDRLPILYFGTWPETKARFRMDGDPKWGDASSTFSAAQWQLWLAPAQ